MIQPTLDYAFTIWDPHTKEDINTLDKVQRRGARFVCNSYTDTVNVEIFARVLFRETSHMYAKFRINKTLMKWRDHSVVD